MPLVQIDGKIGYIRMEPISRCQGRCQAAGPRAYVYGVRYDVIFKSSVLAKEYEWDRIYPFIVRDTEEAIDIDTPEDLAEAENVVRSRNG